MNARPTKLSARDERVSLVSLSLLGMLIFFLFLAANQARLSEAAPSGPEMSAVESLDSLEGGECVDFEELQVGTQYMVDDMFTSGGADIVVLPFAPPVGMSMAGGGAAQVDNNGLAGGAGHDMALFNVALNFDFGKPIMGLTLLFGDYGGDISLEVNGVSLNANNFPDLPNIMGGVHLEVFGGTDNQAMGIMNLTGIIESFSIGGQELWIDDICAKLPDVGDAPDSETNHPGAFMSAYSGPIEARYPTVFDPGTGLPPGPAHWFPRQDAWLGQWVTRELDADLIPDEDTATNLDPVPDMADMDEADDGVGFPDEFPHCEPVEMQVEVTIVGSPTERFVNVWFDWNHNGDWADSFDCPTGEATSEWAVRDFVVTEPNTGTHVITLPAFLPYNIDPVDDAMWARVTLSELPAEVDSTGYADGRGPDFGFRFGETEDYYFPPVDEPTPTPTMTPTPTITPTATMTVTMTMTPTVTSTPTTGTPTPTPTLPITEFSDLGDAPDSETNHTGDFMSAFVGVEAHYPTVYDPTTGLPPGPLHVLPQSDAWFGAWVSGEKDADLMPDDDGLTNIDPPTDDPDRDGFDDGLLQETLELAHCDDSAFDVEVTIVGGVDQRFLNVWFDWNRDGDWEDVLECENGQIVPEWAVQDQLITLGNGTHIVMTDLFMAYRPDEAPTWMRMTLAKERAPLNPATDLADGRGPDNGYEYGETEDYYFPIDDEPTPTPSPTASPTPTADPTIVVTKVAHATEIKIGEQISYTIMVGNEGDGDATDVVVEDEIPAHTSYVDSSASSGDVSYDQSQNQIRWVGDIAASEMVSIQLTVQVHGGANGEQPSLRNALAALATIDFETPALGGSARQVIDPYVDGPTGVVFETTAATLGDEVVGLVKNNSTSACVNPSDENQKLGTGRANGASGGNIGFSGFPIRGTFPAELVPPVTVSVEFQTLAGQPIRLRLFDSAGNEVASTSDVANPANGNCGYPGGQRARTTISATSATEPVAYAMMDMGSVTGGIVFVIDNFEFDSGREDVCEPVITNRARVVLPTGQVIASDQVSTDLLCPDVGDAPDSETNHFGSAMSAYGAALGFFPTVYDPGTGLPEGPAHWKPKADAWLGDEVTLELDADLMPDEDGHPNLVPPADISDWDEADDSLITDTLQLNHCDDSKAEVEVNIVGGANERYLNIWFDWNRDGDWQDRFECANGEVITEWAVQDQVIGLGNGTHIVGTDIFKAYNPRKAVWMRITLAEQKATLNPATGLADGRGPAGGYDFGETEDYIYRPPTGSIHGQKWHDENGNGVKDDNEPRLGGWRILLKDESGHVRATRTDDQGNYWFMDLPSGVYSATEWIPPWSGWMQTFPTTGSHTIDLMPGEVVEEIDFGNWQGGQKDDFCILPWDNHFLTPDSLETQVYIFNDSNTPNKAYTVQLVGLPAGTNGSGAAGPTQFDILDPMPILLNPGEFGTVNVRVYHPDSFAAGNPGPAYFAAIVTNLTSGTSFTCQAALWPVLPWWAGPVNLGIGGIPAGFELAVGFQIMNNGEGRNGTMTGEETINYTARAMTPGIDDSDDGSSLIVSLDGQPAGETISGQVTLGPGEEMTVDIGVEFMDDGGQALGPTDILFEIDVDGDGNPDAITTGIVQAVAAEGATQLFLPLISR